MISVQESIQDLSARLPELEWKLEGINTLLNPQQIPRGLFRAQNSLTPQICIDEIKAELKMLGHQNNEASAHFLTERINRKINVLVRLCKIHADKHKPERHAAFGVRALSTRQQWLQTLEQDIAKLTTQSQALSSRLNTLSPTTPPQLRLNLQAELGEIEQRLTLAHETLARATRW